MYLPESRISPASPADLSVRGFFCQLEIKQFFSYYIINVLYHKDQTEKELTAGGLVLSLFFCKDSENMDPGHQSIGTEFRREKVIMQKDS